MTSLLWLRQDLRLHDQPALVAAAHEGAVIPVYVLDDDAPGAWRIGGAQRWWLHHSLAALAEALEAKGSRLGEFPMALGVIYEDPAPTFESAVVAQNAQASAGKKPDLAKLLAKGQTWMVEKEPHAI